MMKPEIDNIDSVLYKTVRGEGCSETVISKSRFVCRIVRADTREAAESFFAEFKAAHREASHHVPAFVIGDKGQSLWASDDGEPQGTAGAPILGLLTGCGITYVAAMVVRYYGGIKLGTGGLARAYSSAARAALQDAGVVSALSGEALTYRVSYPAFDKVRPALERAGIPLLNLSYAEDVGFEIHIPTGAKASVTSLISDSANGAAKLVAAEPRYIYVGVDGDGVSAGTQ